MAAVRLLLILALICSALAMASPATAAPGAASADCHSMDEDEGAGGATREHEDAPPLLHACPGCAFLGPAYPSAAQAARAAIGLEAAVIPALPSLATSPIPPPPRAA